MPEHTRAQVLASEQKPSNEGPRKTTMAAAAQAQLCRATDAGPGPRGGESASASDSDALDAVAAVSLCLLHDLLGVAAFLASHPLHAVYLLIFARGLASLAAFFWPLLASTSLLLAVLATVGPYLGGAEWPGVRSLGRTCGIAVAALCAELRPDGAGAGAGLVGQLCSFVLGPADAASVLRVEEIMGEPCDISASCFLLEEERTLFLLGGQHCKELAFEMPTMYDGRIGERSFLGYEDFCDFKDEVDEKVVISEDLRGSDPLAEQCCPRDTLFVQEMEAEEEEEDGIEGHGLILSGIDEVSDRVDEKRLECDPVSVEIKKSEPVQAVEIKKLEPVEPMEAKELEIKESEAVHAIEITKSEPVRAVQMKKSEPVELLEIKKSQPVETKSSELVQAMEIRKCEQVQALEVKKSEPVEPEQVESVEVKKCEQVKPRSSIAQRIKLWEAQVSGNVKPVVEDKEDSSVDSTLEEETIKDMKKCVRLETDPCVYKSNCEQQQAQEVASDEESTKEQQEQEFKVVKEYTRSETEISRENCSQNIWAEEAVAQAEEELNQGCVDVQPEPELQEHVYEITQHEQELQEMEELYTDVTSSPAMWSESPLNSTSIAGRVHSRTSSENLVSEGSLSRKDKEWKRTLACKLYEERMQLRLCRDRAVVEGSDNMDMLWEAYEVGGGGGGGKGRAGKRSGSKAKGGANKAEELVDEADEEEEEDDGEEEGSVRQLCCLQALKFSTRKMNFGGGKPSLSKISKVLRRMTALSRMGSRRKQSG